MRTLTPMDRVFPRNRIRNLLMRSGVASFEDLTTLSENDLYAIHGIGCKSVTEIRERLAEQGLSLLPRDASRRDALEALYGSLDAAPLALILLEPYISWRLEWGKIDTLQTLLSHSPSGLRGLTYDYRDFHDKPQTGRVFRDKSIAWISARLHRVGLHLRAE